jgi:hypothetical protein
VIRFAADENLNADIVRGLLRVDPAIDVVRLQDCGLGGASDSQVLAWAAAEGRVLVTHDRETMVAFARARIEAGLAMPGLIVAGRRSGVGRTIEDLRLIVRASDPGDRAGQICFLPLWLAPPPFPRKEPRPRHCLVGVEAPGTDRRRRDEDDDEALGPDPGGGRGDGDDGGYRCDNACPLAKEANGLRSTGREALTAAPSLRAALAAAVERNLGRI